MACHASAGSALNRPQPQGEGVARRAHHRTRGADFRPICFPFAFTVSHRDVSWYTFFGTERVCVLCVPRNVMVALNWLVGAALESGYFSVIRQRMAPAIFTPAIGNGDLANYRACVCVCVLSLSRKHLPNHRMLIIEAGTQTLSRIYYLQSRAGIITGLTNALLSISRGGLSHVCNVSISVYNKHYCLYMKPPRNLGFFVLRFPFK